VVDLACCLQLLHELDYAPRPAINAARHIAPGST
jgi:hypothetical protein